jgi:hypothetical protein
VRNKKEKGHADLACAYNFDPDVFIHSQKTMHPERQVTSPEEWMYKFIDAKVAEDKYKSGQQKPNGIVAIHRATA